MDFSVHDVPRLPTPSVFDVGPQRRLASAVPAVASVSAPAVTSVSAPAVSAVTPMCLPRKTSPPIRCCVSLRPWIRAGVTGRKAVALPRWSGRNAVHGPVIVAVRRHGYDEVVGEALAGLGTGREEHNTVQRA